MRPVPAMEVPRRPPRAGAEFAASTGAARHAPFDLRGFMAGLAVASAVGALLYIFLLTG